MAEIRVQTTEIDAAARGLSSCAADVRSACGTLAGCASAAAAAAGDPAVSGAIEAMWRAWQPALHGLGTALARHSSATGVASHDYSATELGAQQAYGG
jgi:hypothetical protein